MWCPSCGSVRRWWKAEVFGISNGWFVCFTMICLSVAGLITLLHFIANQTGPQPDQSYVKGVPDELKPYSLHPRFQLMQYQTFDEVLSNLVCSRATSISCILAVMSRDPDQGNAIVEKTLTYGLVMGIHSVLNEAHVRLVRISVVQWWNPWFLGVWFVVWTLCCYGLYRTRTPRHSHMRLWIRWLVLGVWLCAIVFFAHLWVAYDGLMGPIQPFLTNLQPDALQCPGVASQRNTSCFPVWDSNETLTAYVVQARTLHTAYLNESNASNDADKWALAFTVIGSTLCGMALLCAVVTIVHEYERTDEDDDRVDHRETEMGNREPCMNL